MRQCKISKEQLIQDYSVDKLSWTQLCVKYSVSLATIKKSLDRYKIPLNTDVDLSKQTFGKLFVIDKAFIKHSHQYWNCKCECGADYVCRTSTLNVNGTISCEECRRLASRDPDTIKTTLWNKYQANAKVRDLEFSITKQYAYSIYLAQDGKCALSGVEIVFSPSQSNALRASTTASLDRVDSSIGYVVGNVQWVHKALNRLKLNMPDDDFVNWCHLVSDHKRKVENDCTDV